MKKKKGDCFHVGANDAFIVTGFHTSGLSAYTMTSSFLEYTADWETVFKAE